MVFDLVGGYLHGCSALTPGWCPSRHMGPSRPSRIVR
ncbi:hypothetical protein BJ970_001227 [Saccharopolyspora phatthalungensis]|uniref:Uncharacterized protein n=1 Tax=Saccharopolyspora phatthalungensis TaxID=664693 RepID=A0A840QA46_9PSEU|nr:hypothetical protein [Saccharopolyspora phatthalungensis]